MSELFAVGGGHIYIGGVKSPQATDFVQSDFNSEVWTEIDLWETMGGVGDVAQLITTQIINRDRDNKLKGTKNAGSMQNNFGYKATDVGQLALIAAAATEDNYAFKVEFDDAPSGGTPTTLYFVALVMNANDAGGGANTVNMLNTTLEVNSNIVRVPAAAS